MSEHDKDCEIGTVQARYCGCSLRARLAAAVALLERWHSAYQTGIYEDARFEGIDDDTTTFLYSTARAEGGEHEWFQHPRLPWRSCRKCGIVERRDGKNRACVGRVDIVLRGSTDSTPTGAGGNAKTVTPSEKP